MKIGKLSFHTLAGMLLIILIVLLPILFIPVPWVALSQAKMLLVAIAGVLLALAWTIGASMGGKITTPRSLMIAAGVLLPIAYLASALLSHAPHALVGSGSEPDTAAAMVLWFFLMIAAAVIASSARAIVVAFRALLASALLAELIEIFGLLIGSHIPALSAWTSPAASIIGSWHDFGIFLGLAVLLSAASLESPIAQGKWRVISWATLILAFPLLVVVNVTDVWIATAILGIIGTLYAWWIGWRRHGQEGDAMAVPHRFTFGLFIAIFLISIAFVFIGGMVNSVLPAPLRIVQTEIRPSWQGTASVASSVYHNGGLLFGSGPNTFESQWGLYKPTGVNETAFWNTDFAEGVGFVPTAFITVGILGAVIWVIFLVLVLVTSIRTVLSRVVSDRTWRFPLFAFALAAVYLWAMLVIYTPGAALIALAFILTGLLAAASASARISSTFTWEFARSRYGFAFVIVPILVVIGVGAASVGIGRALAADMLVNHSITAYNSTGDATAAEGLLNQALAIDPANDRALQGAVELNLIRFNTLAQSSTSSPQVKAQLQDALQRAISNGLSAVSADSSNYQNWLVLAGAYQQLAGVQVTGAYENAQKAYNQAIAVNPSNPAPYLALAELAAVKNDASSTRAYILEALNKKSNYADAYYLLAQLDVSQNNLDEAFTAAQAAVQSDQTQPLLWFELGAIAYAKADYADAVTALEQAVSLDANYANALYVLGFAFYQQKDAADALTAFERVAALNPDNKDVAQIVSLLKAGQPLPTENPVGTGSAATSTATTTAAK